MFEIKLSHAYSSCQEISSIQINTQTATEGFLRLLAAEEEAHGRRLLFLKSDEELARPHAREEVLCLVKMSGHVLLPRLEDGHIVSMSILIGD